MYIEHYAIDNDVFTTVVVQCDMISSAICFKYARVNFSEKQNCTSPLDKTSRLAEIPCQFVICNRVTNLHPSHRRSSFFSC